MSVSVAVILSEVQRTGNAVQDMGCTSCTALFFVFDYEFESAGRRRQAAV